MPYKLKCKEKLVFEVEAIEGASNAALGNVSGGERTAGWNLTRDTNSRAASKYRRAYGFDTPGLPIFGPNMPGRTRDPFIKSDDGSDHEEYEHWRKKRADGFIY